MPDNLIVRNEKQTETQTRKDRESLPACQNIGLNDWCLNQIKTWMSLVLVEWLTWVNLNWVE